MREQMLRATSSPMIGHLNEKNILLPDKIIQRLSYRFMQKKSLSLVLK